jgi:competence protein ComEC
MVVITASFVLGVWLLQQQPELPTPLSAWWLLAWPALMFVPRKTFAMRLLFLALSATLAFGTGYFYSALRAEQRLANFLPNDWQGRNIGVTGVVADLPHKHERGQGFVFNVEKFDTPLANPPQRIYLSTYTDRNATPPSARAGERWRFTVRLKQPHGRSNPGNSDFEAWALENNVRSVGYVYNKGAYALLDEVADSTLYRIDAWREAIRARFGKALESAPYGGILAALAIGDQSSIPPDQWRIFTRTGVNHLMSISGLHITMLAGLGYLLGSWIWRRSTELTLRVPARTAATVLALVIAFGYALLSGFAVPAQRTVYMLGATGVALWTKRGFSPEQILCMALLAVLIPDPWAVLSPGFWLSFGAVALIMYVTAYRVAISPPPGAPPSSPGPAIARNVLIEYSTIQLAMTLGLIPLLLGLFQQVSLVSPIANAVAIPLVSLVVVPLTLIGAVSPLDAPLWVAHQVMSWVMWFLELLSGLPGAVWAQHAPPSWTVVAGVVGVLLLLLPRGFPARWLGMIMLLPMFLNRPDVPPTNTLRLTIFDVGQGLAVAVQTRSHVLLYDTGPDLSDQNDSGNRILIPVLLAGGIDRLDGLILTHDDIDHTGGASSVIRGMPIGWLASSLPDAHTLAQNVPAKFQCVDGMAWRWDGIEFEFLHPDSASYDYPGNRHDNDQGCVLRISAGEQHVLLTADTEVASEQRLLHVHPDKLPATLLVVPHHGSNSSSSEEFVQAVSPKYAVFTEGYRNRFGHPKPAVVQRYVDHGAEILRSDTDGAVIVEMNGHDLSLERYRSTHRRYWTHSVSW